MKAATQSCSGKKVLSKFRQNSQEKNTHKKAHSLAKPQAWSLQPYQNRAPPLLPQQAYLGPQLFYYSKNTHFPEHLLMAASVENTVGKLMFHWSKKMSGLLKWPVDLRNLITRLITSLFRLLELLLEPYSK